jgi:hypothetical protein
MAGEQAGLAWELEVQGWTRQFIIETERADEYVELYESLAGEVLVEPVTPELMSSEASVECILAAGDAYRIIYARSRVGA